MFSSIESNFYQNLQTPEDLQVIPPPLFSLPISLRKPRKFPQDLPPSRETPWKTARI